MFSSEQTGCLIMGLLLEKDQAYQHLQKKKKKKKAFSKNNIGNCIGLLHVYVFYSTYPFVVIWKNRGVGCHILTYLASNREKKILIM